MKKYSKPTIFTEKSFETSALACGKTATPPAGSHHMASAYDTFTGHFGAGFSPSTSVSPGQAGVGFGPLLVCRSLRQLGYSGLLSLA